MAAIAPETIISHWYTFIEGLAVSPSEFYRSLEEAIKSRHIPDTQTSRVSWLEGGIFSARRDYLRVQRKEFLFDICGAPFGPGFFVSWWLGEFPAGCWSMLPVIGTIIRRFIKPLTYYKIDTGLMFQEAVHTGVLEVVDGLTKAKGLRSLSEFERKPILKQFYAR